ncbi:tRNA adenosine(34) deaminase TadA [Porticoccus sp. W117]|uniref:tRNA adenosine(34) deaminase TadA n=1 Tax=Porticoccus sp. W117 TaxID=3054777 RepID=UPI002597D589|nr:tRNA adenosine(34) deaminase TadA [Porticoccus sp. W117]MDM3870141.1 tRNA adenosine(34) deaminase TadA [Porticoccus sp. W117]
MSDKQHSDYMSRALALAARAEEQGEVPVGAVLVRDGEVIGEGWNRPISGCDPSAHAEIVAMRDASAKLQNYRLSGATMYVTIEPCTMCIGAMIHARVAHIVFGAREPRAGAVCSHLQLLDNDHYNHKISWQGEVLENECSGIISRFFRGKRKK